MIESERVSFDILLKKGEYPVITDLIRLGQKTNTAIHFLKRFEPGNLPVRSQDIDQAILSLKKLKCEVDSAVSEHTGLKIERRIIHTPIKGGRRAIDKKEGD